MCLSLSNGYVVYVCEVYDVCANVFVVYGIWYGFTDLGFEEVSLQVSVSVLC